MTDDIRSFSSVPACEHKNICMDLYDLYIKDIQRYSREFAKDLDRSGEMSVYTHMLIEISDILKDLNSDKDDIDIDFKLLDLANRCILTYMMRHN